MLNICRGICEKPMSIFAGAPTLNADEMIMVDKALGNIKISHKLITFCGLISIASKKANMLHY